MTSRQVLAGVVSLVVAAAIITGVVILGSPSNERARRLDQRRVSDLEGMQTAVNFYFKEHAKLPASLEELSRQPGVRLAGDPVTGVAYRYRAVGAEQFELCGTFERASEPLAGSGVDVWQHPAGAHCFTRKVEKHR